MVHLRSRQGRVEILVCLRPSQGIWVRWVLLRPSHGIWVILVHVRPSQGSWCPIWLILVSVQATSDCRANWSTLANTCCPLEAIPGVVLAVRVGRVVFFSGTHQRLRVRTRNISCNTCCYQRYLLSLLSKPGEHTRLESLSRFSVLSF